MTSALRLATMVLQCADVLQANGKVHQVQPDLVQPPHLRSCCCLKL